METTRVAVALVTREGEFASSEGEPSRAVLPKVYTESDGTRVARGRFGSVHAFELCFKAAAHEPIHAVRGAVTAGSQQASAATAILLTLLSPVAAQGSQLRAHQHRSPARRVRPRLPREQSTPPELEEGSMLPGRAPDH